MTPFIFKVATIREHLPITGQDSMIAKASEIYDGSRVMHIGRVGKLLRQLSEQGAATVGEQLHHADWMITADPDQVRTLGMQHDCVTCRARVDQTLAYMAEHPGEELLVGILYWAGP